MKKIIQTVAEGGGELGVHMYPSFMFLNPVKAGRVICPFLSCWIVSQQGGLSLLCYIFKSFYHQEGYLPVGVKNQKIKFLAQMLLSQIFWSLKLKFWGVKITTQKVWIILFLKLYNDNSLPLNLELEPGKRVSPPPQRIERLILSISSEMRSCPVWFVWESSLTCSLRYLLIFLKFVQAIIPTIEYDYTRHFIMWCSNIPDNS